MRYKAIFFLGLLGLTVFGLSACNARLVRGSGDIVVESREISDVDSISLEGLGRVIITQGNTESFSIETDDNLLRHIETRVENGTLTIQWSGDTVLQPTRGITYRVGLRDLNSIQASGAGDFEIDTLATDRLSVNFSGAARLTIDDLRTGEIDLEISGASEIELAGQAESVGLELSGLGRFDAADLEAERVVIDISGGGSARVWAHESLDLSLSGLGEVSYYGNPEVSQDISGGGQIVSLGEK